ncbi:hypothetical protein [Kocuria rosea]|uniref:hypothetical protein n=1 Tax=Kocuria rosea TaxID=1275 RepID=UPI0011A81ADB|nr:hypothetical protein [Kocuria rosea]
MTRPAEGFVIYSGTVFEDGNGQPSVSYSYLSRKGGGDIDVTKSITGEREWLPMLTEKVETFWTRKDAELTARINGGHVQERAILERAESINQGASEWIRLEPGDEGMGL